jgi:hypothetical protein
MKLMGNVASLGEIKSLMRKLLCSPEIFRSELQLIKLSFLIAMESYGM